jgi:hypothetical protein
LQLSRTGQLSRTPARSKVINQVIPEMMMAWGFFFDKFIR